MYRRMKIIFIFSDMISRLTLSKMIYLSIEFINETTNKSMYDLYRSKHLIGISEPKNEIIRELFDSELHLKDASLFSLY